MEIEIDAGEIRFNRNREKMLNLKEIQSLSWIPPMSSDWIFFFEDHGTNKKDDGEGKKKVSGIDCETERRLCVWGPCQIFETEKGALISVENHHKKNLNLFLRMFLLASI